MPWLDPTVAAGPASTALSLRPLLQAVISLMEMGFDEKEVFDALRVSNNQQNAAVSTACGLGTPGMWAPSRAGGSFAFEVQQQGRWFKQCTDFKVLRKSWALPLRERYASCG